MDVTNLIVQLQQKVNDPQLTELDHLTITKTITQLKTGFVLTVERFNQLPSPSLSLGLVYYVVNDTTLYWCDGVRWTNLIQTSLQSIWGWGFNTQGQLGDNNTTTRSSPVSVIGGITDWCQISSNASQTLAVRQNGTLWAWGFGLTGRLGTNSELNRSSPVSVVGGFTDWCQVSAGYNHGAAIRQNGTLWTWGANGVGFLGDGTTVAKSSPVSVIGGFTDWCQVSAGSQFTTAIRQNGTLWTWGYGGSGVLGDGTTVSKSSPVSVLGGFTDWCQVSAVSIAAAAIRQNGTLWAWGWNPQGNLGDGTVDNKSSPVSVLGGFTDWCQVSAGSNHTAAVRQNGTLWAWGRNFRGNLGDNTAVDKSSPVSAVGGFTDWCQVSAGTDHTAAIRQNGTLWAWGLNSYGRLGDGTTVTKSSPVSVIGGFTDWCQVSVGDKHTAAITKYSF